MEFRVLGDIGVERSGEAVPLGSPRQRLLLAILLTAPGEVIPRQALVEAIWDGEEPPSRADRAVQTYVSRLRKELGADRVLSRKPGYSLIVHDGELDGDRFASLVSTARRRCAQGDATGALDSLGEADTIWHGTPWAELAERYWARGPAELLNERRAAAIELEVETLLDLGEALRAIERLTPALDEHPLREGLRRLELLATYRAVGSLAASRSFQRYRELLAESGLEPSRQLIALEERILRDDPTLQETRRSIRGIELIEQIGEGQTSVVWRARQPGLGREVALKVIRSELADDPEVIRRFETQARALSQLDHPNVVPVLDAWRDASGAHVVMPLLETVDASRAAGWSTGEVLRLLDDLADALDALRKIGVAHSRVAIDDVLIADGRAVLGGLGVPVTDEQDVDAEEVTSLGHLGLELLTHDHEAPQLAGALRRAASGELPRLSELRQALGLDATATGGPLRNPFKGLAPFDVGDAEDFFGRKDLVAELVERTAATRLVALVGPSGTGKSSVVRAGVIPALVRSAEVGGAPWFGMTMVPGHDPFEALETGLLRLAVNPPATLREQLLDGERGVARAIDRCLPDDRSDLLLVIDQFEELYTLTPDSDRERFVGGLITAIESPGSRLRILVTLRADFYDRPLSDARLGEHLAAGAVSLPALTSHQLEEIVVGPSSRVGIGFEPLVVAELVRAGVSAPTTLPMVQFALTELVERMRGDVVTSADLEALGGVEGAIGRRAESTYAELDEPLREAARPLFSRLVSTASGSPSRRPMRAGVLDEQERSIVTAFGDVRLLSFDRDTRTREPIVELAHESLVSAWSRLRAWIDEDAAELVTAERVSATAEAWDRTDRDDGELLRGASLAAATSLLGDRSELLTPMEREFVTASDARLRADRDRERRQLRWVKSALAAVAVFLAVALVAGFVAVSQRDDARDVAFEAESQRIAFAAPLLVDTNPTAALLLAAEAYQRSPSPPTLGSLQQALVGSGSRLGHLLSGRRVLALEWLDDDTLAVLSPDRLEIFDALANEPITTTGIGSPALGHTGVGVMAATRTQGSLAIAGTSGDVAIVDGASGDIEMQVSIEVEVRSLAFSPDGDLLYVGDGEGSIHEVEVSTGSVLRAVTAHPNGPFEIPDGYVFQSDRREAQTMADMGVMALAADGDRLLSAGRFSVTSWDRGALEEQWTTSGGAPFGHGGDALPDGTRLLQWVDGLAFDPDDRSQAIVTGWRRFGSISLDAGEQTWWTDPVLERGTLATDVPDHSIIGSSVALIGDDGIARIFDPANGNMRVDPIEVVLGRPGTIAISPTLHRVAIGSVDGVELHSSNGSGLMAATLPLDGKDTLFPTPGGRHLTIASFDDSTVLYDRTADTWTARDVPAQRELGWLDPNSRGRLPDGTMAEWTTDDEKASIRFVRADTLEPLGSWIPDAPIGIPIPERELVLVVPLEPIRRGEPVVRGFHFPSGTRTETVVPLPEGLPVFWTYWLSADGRHVLGTDGDGQLAALDLDTQTFVDPPFSVDGGVDRLRVGPDAEHLYVVKLDASIEERDARSYELRATYVTAEATASDDAIGVFLDPARRQMLTTTGKGPRLTDLESGQPIGGTFPHDQGPVLPGGADATDDAPLQLLTAVDDRVLVWNLDTDEWLDIACRAAGRNLTVDEWERLGPRDRPPRATCSRWPNPD